VETKTNTIVGQKAGWTFLSNIVPICVLIPLNTGNTGGKEKDYFRWRKNLMRCSDNSVTDLKG
jgi:hypothetical protein